MPEFWYEPVFVSEETIFVVERNNNHVLELDDGQKQRLMDFDAMQSAEQQRFLQKLMSER